MQQSGFDNAKTGTMAVDDYYQVLSVVGGKPEKWDRTKPRDDVFMLGQNVELNFERR